MQQVRADSQAVHKFPECLLLQQQCFGHSLSAESSEINNLGSDCPRQTIANYRDHWRHSLKYVPVILFFVVVKLTVTTLQFSQTHLKSLEIPRWNGHERPQNPQTLLLPKEQRYSFVSVQSTVLSFLYYPILYCIIHLWASTILNSLQWETE